MNTAPSGVQYEIAHGHQQATLLEVGGGIGDYTRAGRPLLEGYRHDHVRQSAAGSPLIPWPDRIADGRYRFHGIDHQLALTEPVARNAIHGLTRWANWTPRELSEQHLVMGYVLPPQPGYPFTLHVAIAYQLDQHGLTVATTATNFGDTPCPYAHGHRVYLTTGAELIDDCALHLDAGRVLRVDERGLPTSCDYVIGSRYDFHIGHRLGPVVIDNAYTSLGRDTAGQAWVHLSGPDGHTVRLWADHHYQYLHLNTADTPEPLNGRRGLAVTPMTCAPNGFATGDGLIVLEPGQSLTTRWGIHHDDLGSHSASHTRIHTHRHPPRPQ